MKKFNQSFNCDLDILEELRDSYEKFLQGIGIEDELCQKIIIGLNELVSNIIVHANHSNPKRFFTLSSQLTEAGVLEINLQHNGENFKPDQVELPEINDLPSGGFGLYIINSLFDQVDYLQSASGENLIKLSKKI
jgi:serine/threonine-protein kinase RsbW